MDSPSQPRQVFEVDSLLRISLLYRERLRSDPADMAARTGLAWSLFLQSMLQAGQEQSGPVGEVTASANDSAASGNARHLLTECLQQVTVVRQLSEHQRDRAEMDRLQTLIRLAGEAEAVCAAEEESNRILEIVTRAILDGDAAGEARRRFPRRREGRPPQT